MRRLVNTASSSNRASAGQTGARLESTGENTPQHAARPSSHAEGPQAHVDFAEDPYYLQYSSVAGSGAVQADRIAVGGTEADKQSVKPNGLPSGFGQTGAGSASGADHDASRLPGACLGGANADRRSVRLTVDESWSGSPCGPPRGSISSGRSAAEHRAVPLDCQERARRLSWPSR